MSANSPDRINPDHYKKGGIEVREFIEAVCATLPGDEAFYVANIIKYASRYRDKDGGAKAAEDIRKAVNYANMLIELIERKQQTTVQVTGEAVVGPPGTITRIPLPKPPFRGRRGWFPG